MKYRTRLCLIAGIGGILSIGCFCIEKREQETVQELMRPLSGEREQTQELIVEIDGERHPFSVVLESVPWEEEALAAQLTKAMEGLEAVFLKDNTDLAHIVTEVEMPSMYPDTSIAIQWYLDSWKLIGPDGAVKNEGLTEPVSVYVQAILSLEGQSLVWEREVQVCPFSEPDLAQKLRMVAYQIQESQESSKRYILLPNTVAGESIQWYRKNERKYLWMSALTLLAIGVTVAGKRQEKEKEEQRRVREMQLDYPDIVSRLSLYMGAGISTRKSWERILDKEEREKGHAAYEEMRTTLREMQSGVPEALAYERFGTRCRMPAYRKLGTLLSQNLRKGTKDLAKILQEESREAFEDRKALAKRMGEECESKLLFPMLLMLLTILILVMYPAVISFQM